MTDRILLVEDETPLLRNIANYFNSFGDEFEVSAFTNAEEALKDVFQKPPKILLTDIRLPRMDGLTLLRKALDHQPNLKVIVMTAYSSPNLKQKALRGGALKFIEKPLDLDEILNMVRNLLQLDQGWEGTMEGLEIFDFVQIMVLCQKSKTLHCRNGPQAGTLVFSKGNLVHASTKKLHGKEAFFEIMSWRSGRIKEIPVQTNLSPNIKESATFLMMEAARMQDEHRANANDETDVELVSLTSQMAPKGAKSKTTTQPKLELRKESMMAIKDHLNELTEIEGFQAAAVFTAQGEMLESVSVKKMDMNAIGMYANNALLNAQKATDHMGVGRGNMVQIRAPKAHIILRCHNEATDFAASKEGRAHVHCAVVMSIDGNSGMAAFMLDKIVGKLADELR